MEKVVAVIMVGGPTKGFIFVLFYLFIFLCSFILWCGWKLIMILRLFFKGPDFGHYLSIHQSHCFHWLGSQWFNIRFLLAKGFVSLNYNVLLMELEHSWFHCSCVDTKFGSNIFNWILWGKRICLVCFFHL